MNLFQQSNTVLEKVVLVANERPFLNSGSGYNITYGDNDQLVQNIWDWLLE